MKKLLTGFSVFLLVALGTLFVSCPDGGGSTTPAAPITAGLYQKAPPISASDTPIASVEANNLTAAVNYAKANAAPGKAFTMVVDTEFNAAAQNINTANFDLTIVGTPTMKTITYTGADSSQLFNLITDTPRLTIGNNITLRGKPSSHAMSLIYIGTGTFTMSGNSKITGHQTSGAHHSAVYIYGGLFVMEGQAEISGNSTSLTTADASAVGVSDTGTFVMRGGSITNNTSGFSGGTAADVYVDEDTCTLELSGNATIGSLALTSDSVYNASVYIGPSWTGRITELNLLGGGSSITGAIACWYNASSPKSVVKGADSRPLTAADINRITTGKFRCSGTATQIINGASPNQYYISTAAGTIGMLLKR